MRIICFLLLITFFATSDGQATVLNWTGNGDGITWEDKFNWDLIRIPIPTDSVYIASDSVTQSSSATIHYLQLNTGVVNQISGTSAEIVFSNSGVDPAFRILLANGSAFYMNNDLTIETSKGYIFMSNSKFHIMGGELLCSFSYSSVGIDMDFSDLLIDQGCTLSIVESYCSVQVKTEIGSFENHGLIFISESSGTGLDVKLTGANNYGIIDINDHMGVQGIVTGQFVNHPGAEIVTSKKMIVFDEFNNYGSILSNCFTDHSIELTSSQTVFNNYAKLDLTWSSNAVFQLNSGELNNHVGGTIKSFFRYPTINSTEFFFYFDANGHILNQGIITLESTSAKNLKGFNLLHGNFANSGTITLKKLEAGFYLTTGADFQNISGGVLLFEDTKFKDIETLGTGASLNNDGIITSDGSEGIYLRSNSAFTNTGTMSIINGTNSLYSLQILGASYILNSGKLILKNALGNRSVRVEGTVGLVNTSCGYVEIDGIYLTNPLSSNISEGVIYDKYGNTALRNMTIGGFYYRPLYGKQTTGIKETMPFKYSFDFSINGLFTNSTYASSAGIFNIPQLSWTPNLGGSVAPLLYFRLNSLIQGCNHHLKMDIIDTPICNSMVSNNFTGTIDSDWAKAGNWSASWVPDYCTNVQISAGNNIQLNPNYRYKANKINVLSGAVLDLSPGAILDVPNLN